MFRLFYRAYFRAKYLISCKTFLGVLEYQM